MKKIILPLLLLSSIAHAGMESCLTTRQAPCLVELEKLHPTQLTLGKISLPEKIKKLEKNYKKGKLEERLTKKAIPAVLGPDLLFYIQDGHHEIASLELSQKIPLEAKIAVISQLEDKSNLSPKAFKQYMLKSEKVFLLDENFKIAKFEDIPRRFINMKDNPYRSFAWLVKENGGFCKVSVNYLEFIWGKFFKDILEERNIILNSDPDLLNSYLEIGIKIAQSDSAKQLPGFKESNSQCTEESDDL